MANITAVIPAYNEEKTVGRVLGIAAQTIAKVVVVDDGSTDRTCEIVRSFMKKHKGVKLIRHKKNMGKSIAVKTAANHVRTPYVLFLDADLVGLNKSHINQFKEAAKENPSMVVGLRDRGGRFGEMFMRIFPIGGERMVKTDIVKALSEDPLWKEYNMELLMNWFVRKHSRISFVKLRGLNHTIKPRKWGLLKGSLALARQFLVITPLAFFALVLRAARQKNDCVVVI